MPGASKPLRSDRRKPFEGSKEATGSSLSAELGLNGGLGSMLLVLAGDSLIYLVGLAIIGLGNLILVPFFMRYLAPAEFGVYALVDVTIAVLMGLSLLKLDVSYLKWFAEFDGGQREEMLWSVLLAAALASGVLGALLALGAASPVGERWLQTTDRTFAWTLLPVLVLESLQGLLFSDLRARRRAVAYSVLAALRLFAMLGASVWFVAVKKQGLCGFFLGRLTGDAVCVAALCCLCLSLRRIRFRPAILRPMLRFGLPLAWAGLMLVMLDATGRYILSRASTMEEVGLYGAAIKISSVFQILIAQPFGVAWGGLMFQIAPWPNAPMVYSKILNYVLVLSLTGALVIALFTPTLFTILASAPYFAAVAVFPLVLLVQAVRVMEYPAAVSIYLAGKTKHFAWIYTLGLCANVAVNCLLTPAYGMFGAVWAWLVSGIIIIVLTASLGQRYYALHYEWKLPLLIMAPWVAVLLARHGFIQALIRFRWPAQAILALVVLLGGVLLVLRDVRLTDKALSSEEASR